MELLYMVSELLARQAADAFAGFNDAISVASDLTAAQLVLAYWTSWHPWVVPLIFFFVLVAVNAFPVGAYGEFGECLLIASEFHLTCWLRRVLACEPKDYRHHRVHLTWHPRQRWSQYGPPLPGIRVLAHPRRTIRWRLWRIRVGFRYRELRLYAL